MRAAIIGLVLALTAVCLGGCYASDSLLLDADAAVHPLEDGVYMRDGDAKGGAAPNPGEGGGWRLTLDADGWYEVERLAANGAAGQTGRVLLNPMDAIAGHTAYAAATQTDRGFAYAVIVTDGPRVFLAAPDCADPLDRSLAVDQGAQTPDDDPMTPSCDFKTKAALTAALADFAGQAEFGRPYLKR